MITIEQLDDMAKDLESGQHEVMRKIEQLASLRDRNAGALALIAVLREMAAQHESQPEDNGGVADKNEKQ